MLMLKCYFPGQPRDATHCGTVLQGGSALAPKAITKHHVFFKMVTLIMFVVIYVTDCFNSILILH